MTKLEYDRNLIREKRKLNPSYGNEGTIKLRQDILALFNNKCIQCGFSDKRALQIDHVNGNGHKEDRRGSKYLKKVLDSVLNKENEYQVLCANCNWIKRVINNEVSKNRFV